MSRDFLPLFLPYNINSSKRFREFFLFSLRYSHAKFCQGLHGHRIIALDYPSFQMLKLLLHFWICKHIQCFFLKIERGLKITTTVCLVISGPRSQRFRRNRVCVVHDCTGKQFFNSVQFRFFVNFIISFYV